MAVTERYQVNVFAIMTLIVLVLVIVFLIISAIYFSGLMNLRPPTRGESTFLFWTAVILAVILTVLAIWSIVEILTHKAIICETPKPAVVYQAPVASALVAPATVFPAQTTTVNLPAPATTLSTSFSDIPVPTAEQQVITTGLINVEGAFQ
jgi:hypothetical protein